MKEDHDVKDLVCRLRKYAADHYWADDNNYLDVRILLSEAADELEYLKIDLDSAESAVEFAYDWAS